MEQKHIDLLKKMISEEVAETKILDYFKGEGYEEGEILRTILEVVEENRIEIERKKLAGKL